MWNRKSSEDNGQGQTPDGYGRGRKNAASAQRRPHLTTHRSRMSRLDSNENINQLKEKLNKRGIGKSDNSSSNIAKIMEENSIRQKSLEFFRKNPMGPTGRIQGVVNFHRCNEVYQTFINRQVFNCQSPDGSFSSHGNCGDKRSRQNVCLGERPTSPMFLYPTTWISDLRNDLEISNLDWEKASLLTHSYNDDDQSQQRKISTKVGRSKSTDSCVSTITKSESKIIQRNNSIGSSTVKVACGKHLKSVKNCSQLNKNCDLIYFETSQ